MEGTAAQVVRQAVAVALAVAVGVAGAGVRCWRLRMSSCPTRECWRLLDTGRGGFRLMMHGM